VNLDAGDLPDRGTHSAEICIIGAGPAGLALATGLRRRRSDLRIVILESGGIGIGGAQALTTGTSAGDWTSDLSRCRARGVGGTALLWNTVRDGRAGAKYVPLDPIDLEPRDELPFSGWPFPFQDLLPWYDAARALIGLDDSPDQADATAEPALPFRPDGLTTSAYRWGPATTFLESLPGTLSSGEQLTLIRNATVTALTYRGPRVDAVRWAAANGRTGTIHADQVILAAGALENARMLLAFPPTAIAEHAWLGRGLMEHPIDRSLRIRSRDPALSPRPGRYSAVGGGAGADRIGRIGCSCRMLQERRLWNASLRLYPVREPRAVRLLKHGAALAGVRTPTSYRVLLDLEQAPHPENRVALSPDVDAFGVPRVHVTWHWLAADERNRQRMLQAVAGELEACGCRAVVRHGGVIDPDVHHHAGTTRMHRNPEQGVVDADLRVHGMDNLHVVGASVFPTAGVANPTLTIVALALRLAERLRGSL
jgi:MYXO-CTERM domain-containing protein